MWTKLDRASGSVQALEASCHKGLTEGVEVSGSHLQLSTISTVLQQAPSMVTSSLTLCLQAVLVVGSWYVETKDGVGLTGVRNGHCAQPRRPAMPCRYALAIVKQPPTTILSIRVVQNSN